MTQQQVLALAELLGIEQILLPAIRDVLVSGQPEALAAMKHSVDPTTLSSLIAKIHKAEVKIRGAFILHSPSCWEVVVGHHDHHRAPGRLQLNAGATVRLICARVHVMVPIRITELPATPHGYYLGTVLDVPHTSMKYHEGDGAMFSEDQAVLTKATRAPRRPIPI